MNLESEVDIMKLYLDTIVELVKRDKERNHIFDLTLEQCDYLNSKGVVVEKVKNSIYPVHYKLTYEK